MKPDQLIKHIYWASLFGIPKRKISAEALFADPTLIERPIFFLSTGRCGTEWFTYLLRKDKANAVLHDPSPSLSIQNKFMFEKVTHQNETAIETGKHLFFAGREQHLRYIYKAQRRYIETNNHITFFAYALAEIFPTADFIHLYRHPGDFVTSGMNRGWFGSNEDANTKMIEPYNGSPWKDYLPLEKIGWVWNETNAFIEDFKKKYPHRVHAFDFTERDSEKLHTLLKSLGISIKAKVLDKALEKKRNVQHAPHYPKYKEWEEHEKLKLKAICEPLSKAYQYEL